MFEHRVHNGVLQVSRPRTRWLSTGWNGGPSEGEVAYNVSVPEGWERTELSAYVETRREQAGFSRPGPTLLTGVDLKHARSARYDSVEVIATAGVSNPAALPMNPSGERSVPAETRVGTVNLIVGTSRSPFEGALANMLTIAAEAKAATLFERTGVPGTTTDAVIVACDPSGERVEFTGSATPVGAAVRACVREAVSASLDSRYAETTLATAEEAKYGLETTERAEVFELSDRTDKVESD